MSEHATLSASGSHRWLNCPPSALLEKQFPDRSSESAREGTFAHSLGELILRDYCFPGSVDYLSEYEKLKKGAFYNADLEDYVRIYSDLCIEKYNAARIADSGAAIMLESRLDYSRWVPQGFGRGDTIIISNGVLEIIDLKFGRNVEVRAEDNPQLRLYALGAMNAYEFLYEFDTVRMTICQPRKGGVSEEEMPIAELIKWGESIRPVAELAIKGGGEFKAGEHCQFCKAAARCRALSEYSLALAKLEFQGPELLDDDEIADALGRLDALVKYAKALKTYALNEALNGHRWPGWKVVEGRSNSKYRDQEQVAKVLIDAGFNEQSIYKPRELIGITEMKKVITTKSFNALLPDLLIKPAGKPALAPESDKRPEYNSADADFQIENEGDDERCQK